MNITSFSRADLSEQQAAFTGLLAHPLVAPWTFPDLFRLVNRHQHRLDLWCARLNYNLLRIDQCFRLRRVPINGRLVVPTGTPPSRRILVLALLAAAILEDERQDSITLQDISDAVRRFSVVNQFRAYDPEQRPQRTELLGAVRFLVDQGVLEQRTQRADLIDTWQHEGLGIGAGYLIHRDALVLMVDTHDAELALGADADPSSDNRSARILRQLVETQVLETDLLSSEDAAYLIAQRARLIDQVQEMTGGIVEVRRDAWLLVFPSDQGLDPSLLISFPEPTALDWAGLALLDSIIRISPAGQGRRFVPDEQVDECATQLYDSEASHLTVSLKQSPAVLRQEVERRLADIGLIKVTDDGWTLLPVAARYRNAALERPTAPPHTAQTLFEEEQ